MLFIILAILVFFCGLLKDKSHPYIKICGSILLSFLLALIFYECNANGQDWVNYNTIFQSNNPDLYYYYEPLFSLFLHSLLFLSSGSYDVAIFLFYFFVFLYLSYVFHQFDLTAEYWLSVVIFSLGSTLFTDQLRQLLATCFVITAFLIYIKNDNRFSKFVLMYIIAAILSHYSAFYVIFVFVFSRIESKINVVILSCIISGLFLIIFSPSFLSNIAFLPIDMYKIEYYTSSVGQYNWGPLTLLSFAYVVYFVLFSRPDAYRRVILLAAILQLSVVSFFPGLFRLAVYNIAISAVGLPYYLRSGVLSHKLLKIKAVNFAIVLLYSIVILLSYYVSQDRSVDKINFLYVPFM